MPRTILGIHHVTAIAGDAQRNVDFYAGILGLRLVKLTVNFDDPFTYHLYYGDATGRPGTILTFFPWAGIPRGHAGNAQVVRTAFSVPAGAIPFWIDRFAAKDVSFGDPATRFGESALSFEDSDGLGLEIVESAAPGPGEPLPHESIPATAAIRGFHSVTLSEEGYEGTADLLTTTMGWRAAGEEHGRFRFLVGEGGASRIVDVLCAPDAPGGRLGAGIVHHVAWRTPDDAQQEEWRAELARLRYNVTPSIDRQYFRSIYFREPGGVLFEIATDPPGFARDEPLESLGTRLQLPPWLEPRRTQIEERLPSLRIPRPASAPRA